jgi:polysaccharide biosynthesis protein VpsM
MYMKITTRITIIYAAVIFHVILIDTYAFSQGNIHLGPIQIHPSLAERIEFDDNIFQVSGKETTVRGREKKESDLINIYTPGLKLILSLGGGQMTGAGADVKPEKRHKLSLDWHSDFKNYRDNAAQNQQNHYFTASAIFRYPKGLSIALDDTYEDVVSPAASETDNFHPRKTNIGSIKIGLPHYFRKFDVELKYTNYDQDYDERALKRANRFEHNFTLKIPYKLTKKIKLFPEYTYGLIEYDSQSGVTDPQSDSHYNEIYAGAEWYATAKTTGILKLGFVSQDYDDTRTTDINTFIAEIGVKVYLTKRMDLNINAGRGIEESEFTASSNSFERSFGDFNISSRVWKDLNASLHGNYQKLVFHDSKRKDDIYEVGFSTIYSIKKWMLADFRYSYIDRHSNFDAESDRINKVSFGINLAF